MNPKINPKINPKAEKLNQILKQNNPVVYDLMSQKGREIFFPKDGLLMQAKEAKGTKINATIGIALEDDGSPMRLKSIDDKVLLNSREIFPYASSFGKQKLREKWLEMIYRKNPSLQSRTSLPVVTNALTHGLSITGYLFVNKGDKIILPDKFWGNYRLIFEQAHGAKLDTFNTFSDGGFDINSFHTKLTQGKGKKIVMLNFPNNPSGYTPTKQESSDIVDVIGAEAKKGNELLVLLDDAYFGLVYESEVYTESLFGELANLSENVLVAKIDGATKEDYVWGLRCGFVTYATKNMALSVCDVLEDKTGAVIRGNISSASHLSQSLVLGAFNSSSYSREKKEKFEILKGRYEKVKKILAKKKYSTFEALPFNSGYFMCVKPANGVHANDVRELLLSKYDTGVMAIGNLVRVAYSSVPEKDLDELFENLHNACLESKV